MQVENLEPRLVPSVTAPENPYQQQVKQIVFVDSSIPNRESLFDATMLQNSTTEVVQLNALQNGLEQIANALAAKTNLEAIHVFSHGQQGKIVLGNTTVGTNEINSNLDYLSTIGKSLTADGDLLLYGCYVADGFVGQDFVNRLAEVTGADVAASDDATGDVVTGGNWNLEQTTGPVETTSLPGDIGNNLLNNYTISIGQNSPRLYWQGRDTGSARYAQPFTDDQYVAYFAQVWKTKTWEYSVPTGWFLGFPTKWEKRTGTSSWQENEYRLYNYGAGTRYGTANITLTAGTAGASTYQFYITPNSLIKNWLGQGQDQGSLSFRYNLALYKDSFNPNDPMRNLVGGGLTSISWVGNTDLLEWDRYSAGNYIAVLSYDDYITQDHYNAFWGSLNRHAEQLWGSFTIQVQNMNQAPVWGTVSNQSVTGSGSKSFSVPWSAVSDPDGNPLSVSATLSSGAALPSWLSFNANSLTFTGNPPPNTTPLTIRLTASDGQATATRDFTVTFSADNDRPTVAIAIPTQTWDGSGAFSYQVPSGTFADSDPSGTSFTYTASLADGSALPAWLSFNTTTRTFSGNPPANASDLTLRVIADDGSGQANATVNADFTLRLLNNNDIPSLTGFNKTLNEDSTVSFSAGDFSAGFTDTDSHAVGGNATTGAGKSLDRVRILSLPANGSLWLDADNDGVIDNGEAIAVNQEIVNGDLGKLRFTPNADWTGVTSFSWNASDGVAYATNAATAALTVQLVDDAPRLTMSTGRTLTLRPNTGNALSTPVLVDSGLTLIDVDAAYTSDINFDTIYGATVTVVDSSSGNFQSGDVLAATGISGKITVSYNSASGALSLSGEARAAEYQQVLRTLAFSSTNTSNDNLRQVNISLRTKNVTASVVANFDGVDDYIETLRASIPMGGDWTVSVWARADNSILGSTGEHTILAQGTSSENFYLQRASASNNLRLGDNWTYSGGMPTDGQWHQYTVVRSGSGATDGTLYIDGIKVSTGNLPDVLPGTGLRIGQLYKRDNTQEWGGFWKGSVSDLRVYNRALNGLEVSASLNEATPPSGYEANLVSWFPLNGSADNKAVSSWNLGRDFDPRSPQWSQGPWDLGYLNIGQNTSDFPSTPPSGTAFLSFDRAGSTPTLTLPRNNGDVVRVYSGDQNTGYIEFMPNTAENITGTDYKQRPGEVMMLPNVYPTAAQFTAPISGVFGVDARFWRTFTSAGNPKYRVYKLSGSTMSEVDAGAQISGGDPSGGTVSGLRQIVLEQGEKLIFAVHRNGDLGWDETSLSLQVDLLATKVSSGGADYYYSHSNGHYYGLPSGTANWTTAKSNAEALNVAGQSGYLATPTDSASMQIVRAILTNAGVGNAWAGARQINSNNEPAGNFYWATGPKAGQPFNGSWNDGEPNNYNSVEHYVDLTPNKYNDNNGANALRYVVEFGDAKLALPTQLTDNISGNSAPGNALIFQQADVAYSARTGHYYKVDSTGRTWDDAASNAAAIGNMFAGQRGYLARITDLNELRIAGWFNRLRNQDSQWVGLRQTNTSNEPAGGWQWVSGDEAGMTSDANFSTPTFWRPGEPNNSDGGQAENFGGMNGFGFALNDFRNTQTLGSLIEYGIDGQVLTIPLFGLPPAQSSALNVVTIGDAGNSADSGTGNLYGDVGYAYQIGKYEITIAEYTAFLNAVAKSDPNGLWNPSMATDLNVAGISRSGSSGSYSYSAIGSGNRPITYVSWGDAARYANWVHNGKPSGAQNAGTTEDGAYTLTSSIGDGGWNLASDFSTTNNPNGAWTYGYQTSNNPTVDGFTAFTHPASNSSYFYWLINSTTGIPSVALNRSTGQGMLHPGTSEAPAIARWTSPFTGSVTLSGTFGAGDIANLDAYIRVNGQVVWSALDFSTDQSFTVTRSVTAGDRIDFLVTGGTDYGTTPLTVSINAAAPAKNTGARFWIPTEDEWYKAAYYKGGGTNSGYWLYATQNNTAPDNTIGGSANQANYYAGDYAVTQSSSLLAGQNYLTDVGAFTNSASFYGTFDQSGNVWEWTDDTGAAGSSRTPRGGAWDSHASGLPSSFRTPIDPSLEGNYVGFRLAGALLPESTRTVSGFSNVAVRVGNTAPSLTSSWSVNTPEDTTFSFTAEQFSSRFSDPELDSLASITLTAIPSATAGVLRLDGSTLANSAVLKAGDLARLQFVPAAHFNGNATFSYTASDGYLSSSSSSTVTISVTAANDAPVLDISGSPVATTIAEDVSSANNNGTTVATLVIDGSITDVDVVSPASAPEAMAVTSVDNSNGLWQYKVGSGSWTSFSSTRGVVNLGGAALLLDGTDSVRFVPDANYNGTASFTYRAWDKSSGSAGGTSDPFAAGGNTALSAAEETASITISAVNDAPTTAGKTISFNEDSSYVFTAGDFAFSDLDAGASLSSITITALPATGKGSITLFNGSSDVAVSANQVISLADITAGKLKYTPPADAFGTSYASIDFTVSDGSASSSAATITFDVADTNDAPTAIVWATGGTVAENSAAHTVVGSLTATDLNAGDVLRFRITNNSNFYVTPNGTVKVAENATIDFEQASTQTITVEVSDSGGLTYSQNLTVTLSDVVESDPSVYATPLYVALNSITTITTANLRAADAQQTAAQLVFTIINPPTGGTFWIDSDGNGAISGNEKALGFRSESNPSAVNTFTQDDINNGRLKFSKDSSQTSGQMSVEVSDGTGGSKPRATLVLIPSSPPVLSPVADQQWSTTGAQSFRLPANTFSDPDQDELTVSALLVTGPSTTAALPSWLSFNASTWTFSGTPTGQADGSSITLRVSASDGRTTAVSDDFVISFVTTRTAPSVANPIANQVFDGDGTKSFVVPSNTFSDPNNATITYGATLANGSALPTWLSFNAGTRTLSGNPPASAVPGPYWIKVTGTSTGGSAETFFRLDVVNANDNPVESPAGTIPDRTLTADGSFTVNRSAFSDLDGGTLALNATLADGNPLPSWLQYSFDASTGVGTFTTNLPGGSGSATVRVVADDGLGGSGFADFTINYSGGTNAAPQVRTAAGTSTMVTTNTSNGGTAQELRSTPFGALSSFVVNQGATLAITANYLQEADPDDDGTGVTFTITTAPTKGQLWLDADGSGTINGSEAALGVNGTFTQSDIDAGRLKYRHTAANAIADSFVFSLADGGEDGAAPVTGVTFNIGVVATPAGGAPVLQSVSRADGAAQLTRSTSLKYRVVFNETVSGVDASDFVFTGTLAGSASLLSVEIISGTTYLVTASLNVSNANGTLGLALAASPTITNLSGIGIDAMVAPILNDLYTVDNAAPLATVTASSTSHNGSAGSAFEVTFAFNEAIDGLTLADFTATNATLSDLVQLADANGTPINSYSLTVTPTAASPITVTLLAGGVSDQAGNTNAAASITVLNRAVITGPGSATGATASVSVAENSTAVHTFTADKLVSWSIPSGSAGGADAARFTIDGSTGALVFNSAPNFESSTDSNNDNVYEVIVRATDSVNSFLTDQTISVTVTDINEAPTAVSLTNTTTSVAENTSTASRIKVADIVVTDDALGSESITLTGADAASFEVDGLALYLKAGITLDFETQASYAITVNVADTSLSGSTPVTVGYSLTVTDVNEAPTAVSLTNTTTSVAENTSTASRIKVADIVVTDDALGSESITLTGADAASFEVDGLALYLKAGVVLDFETKTSYAVTVNVADTSLSGSTPVTVSYILSVNDVNEFVVTSLSDNGSSGTLRWAITQANTQANALGGADTITFHPSLSGTILLTSDLPNITESVTVTGPGQSVITIDGNNQFRPFALHFTSPSATVLTVSDLTLRRGGPGGLIWNRSATVNATRLTIADTTAVNGGYRGAVSTVEAGSVSTYTDCVFRNNSVGIGSDWGETNPSQVSNNDADYPNRTYVVRGLFENNTRGMWTNRFVRIEDSTFRNNTHTAAILDGNSRVQVLNSTFENNLRAISHTQSVPTSWTSLGTNHRLHVGNTFRTNGTAFVLNDAWNAIPPGRSQRWTTLTNNNWDGIGTWIFASRYNGTANVTDTVLTQNTPIADYQGFPWIETGSTLTPPPNAAPIVTLGSTATNQVFTGAAISFTGSGVNLTDVNNITFDNLKVSFAKSLFVDGVNEKLYVNGATSGGDIGLNPGGISNGSGSFVLNGTTFDYGIVVASGTATITITGAGGAEVTIQEAESILDALRYDNISAIRTSMPERVFSVMVTDGGGLSSNTETLTIRLTPSTPSILNGSEDTGLYNNDRVTRDNTLTFGGLGGIGDTIEIVSGTNVVGTGVVGSNGSFTITTSVLSNGVHNIHVVARNGSGISSVSSPSMAWEIRNQAMAQPVVGSNNGLPQVTGTGPLGSNISVTIGAGTYRVPVDNAGNWTLNLSTAVPVSGVAPLMVTGTYAISVIASDLAGNASAPVNTSLVVTTPVQPAPVITSNPSTRLTSPVVTGVSEVGSIITLELRSQANNLLGTYPNIITSSSGTWSVSLSGLTAGTTYLLSAVATDANMQFTSVAATQNLVVDTTAPARPVISSGVLTKDSTPVFAGSAEANALVELVIGRGNGSATTMYHTVVDANGHWAVDFGSMSPVSGYLNELSDGNYRIEVTAVDAAGNRSLLSAVQDPFRVDTMAPQAPSIGSNLLTNDSTPLISGTAEAGSTVTVVVGGNSYTVAVGQGGTWSLDLGTASPSLTLADGMHSVTVFTTDLAGNVSEAVTRELRVDATAPGLPLITSGNKSNDLTPLITGSAEPGSTVTVTIGSFVFTTSAGPSGAWSVNLDTAVPNGQTAPIQPLQNATSYVITVVARDAAGNVSASATQTLNVDQTAPDAPVFTSSGYTNQVPPTITGTAQPNSTLTLLINNVITNTVPVDGSGNWVVNTTGSFPEGSYAITAYCRNSFNNQSGTSSQTLVVDQTAPVITAAVASFGSNLNLEESNTRAVISVFVTGMEDGQTASVLINNMPQTALVYNGKAMVTVPAAILQGISDGVTTSFTVSVTDRAGNNGSLVVPFTVDKSGPARPSFAGITSSQNDPTPGDRFTSMVNPTVVMSGEPGQSVEVMGPNGLVNSSQYTVTETNGVYTISFTTQQIAGDYVVNLRDGNGNSSPQGTGAQNYFRIDSLPILFDNPQRRATSMGSTFGNLSIKNILNGQVFDVPQQQDGSWIDLDGQNLGFGLAGGTALPNSLVEASSNGAILRLNTITGAYTYTPVPMTDRMDSFLLMVMDTNGNQTQLQLTFNSLDTLDRDGIMGGSESALAGVITGTGSSTNLSGDLNRDGVADANQNSVSTLAWRKQTDFQMAMNPNTASNTDRAAIVCMVVNGSMYNPSTTTTLAQLMGDVDPLAQLLQIEVVNTSSTLPETGNFLKPWDLMNFAVESLVSSGLNDINPDRAGTQVQVSIDISNANIPAGALGFSLYRKFISAGTITAYADAGITLTDLSGVAVTAPGWYDYTQRAAGGDGATFKDFNNDGKLDAIIITLTDNSFGDDSPVRNRVFDPGTPGSSIQSNPGGANPSVPTPPGSSPSIPNITGYAATGKTLGAISGTNINMYPVNTTTATTSFVPFAGFQGEVRLTRADINNDGTLDVIASMGASGSPLVRVFDGSNITNKLLEFMAYDQAFTGGVYIAAGDVNRDGVVDIVTGAGAGGGPHVRVFSGVNASELGSFFVYATSFTGGVSVAVADLNLDGYSEIVTGAGPGGGPHVKVFDGNGFGLIKEFMAYDPSFRNGIVVAAGDYLSDGKREIITGAGPGGGPHVKIWDYETLNVDGQFMAYGGVTDNNGQVIDQFFSCGVRVALADVNGDNINDLLTGAGQGGGPHVKAFVGFEMELLLSLFSGDEEDRSGVFVS